MTYSVTRFLDGLFQRTLHGSLLSKIEKKKLDSSILIIFIPWMMAWRVQVCLSEYRLGGGRRANSQYVNLCYFSKVTRNYQ